MTNIDYEMYEEAYGNLPTRTPIRGNTSPVGSLTDNRREVKADRDGAIKRLRAIKEASHV
jgi:hypothetical protein